MKTRNGCWTCKSKPRSRPPLSPISLTRTGRKIGCDRNIPNCNNCSRTSRQCLGYGLRLTWPGCQNKQGHRQDALTYEPPSSDTAIEQHRGRQFISFREMDILASKEHVFGQNLWEKYLVERPQFTLSLHSPIVGQVAILLNYLHAMGFLMRCCPWHCPAAMLRLQHCRMRCLQYRPIITLAQNEQRSTISRLSESLSSQDSNAYNHISDVQLAACLMLAMYSVCLILSNAWPSVVLTFIQVFDNDDGNWHVHLQGSRGLVQLSATNQHRDPSSFLLTWLLYYEVLGNFSHPSHASSYDVGAICIQGSRLEDNYIIGHLGCSVEILEIIHEINGLRSRTSQPTDHQDLQPNTESRIWLDGRLQALNQRIHPDENLCTTRAERCRTLITAELYRLAAILYLQRVCPIEGDHARRVAYLGQAFDAYAKLETVSSPWPLFVVACESRKDKQRVIILDILDEMNRARSIGNLVDMRNAIEMYWKQCDLRADMDQARQLEWWRFVDCGITVPWFV
ncbi:unnamed protein product [Clonostachys rosea]|uniref:Zn(2)-C6 fungal-type domain-containing protein n=1 Tax=Bionectria ochroleuca TaxID=29856 RepID=A0ABY6U3N6_BIOOC|nr:unnamed protein product [Clonostachys rosea]